MAERAPAEIDARTAVLAAPEPSGLERSLRAVLKFVRRKPLGAFGGFLVLLAMLSAIGAPWLAPFHPNETDAVNTLQGPTLGHFFGTDNLGRDIFSRVLWGGRYSLLVGFGAVALSMVGGTAVGMVSGFAGRRTDLFVQRVVDALLAIPGLILILTLMAVLEPGVMTLIIAIGFLAAAPTSRVLRSNTLMVRNQPYIEAARALGSTPARIVLRHVLPNIAPTIIILATIGLSAAILTEASLSFLGFGVPPPNPTWGQMLGAEVRPYFLSNPWLAVFPGIALSLAVFGFNMLGDGLRDVLDPRLRNRV